jgi:hypothetical protein
MRILLAVLVLGTFVSTSNRQAIGQAAPTPSGWARVETLPAGSLIDVHGQPHQAKCVFKSASDDTLVCVKKGVDVTFQRKDIDSIKLPRRGRSAFFGSIPGLAIIAGGFITLAAENCKDQVLCGLGAGLFIALGFVVGVIGALVGSLTEFAGPTIYDKP